MVLCRNVGKGTKTHKAVVYITKLKVKRGCFKLAKEHIQEERESREALE